MSRPAALLRPGWRFSVVCASGPSFTEEQAAQIIAAREAGTIRVIVVNDNWRRVPNADVLYASDSRWWTPYHAAVRDSGFAGELWTQDEASAAKYGLRLVRQTRKLGLTKTDRLIHGGGNSGHHAIQLDYLFGAEHIGLVGFDMRADEHGRQHWFGEHPQHQHGGLNGKLAFPVWIERIESMAGDLSAAGVQVVNCSPVSRIECFPRADLSMVLAQWKTEASAVERSDLYATVGRLPT